MMKKELMAAVVCIVGVLSLFTGCNGDSGNRIKSMAAYDSPKYRIELHGAEDAAEYFSSRATTIEQSRSCSCVSPFFVQILPDDMAVMEAEAKKQLFLSIMLPVIVRENLRIELEREKIVALQKKSASYKRLFWREQAFLNRICAEYGVKTRNFEKLLKRVDVIPESLVLAQAIIESGWGTSRFALQGNALYGVHWPPKSKKKYMVSRVGRIRIAVYDSIGASTRYYMQLLNSGAVYDGLRTRRLRLRKNGRAVSGMKLTASLSNYSELGRNYGEVLDSVITTYRLEKLNAVQFREDQRAVALSFN
jgi:Bax protein